jgi:hypothetical protein
MLRKQALSEAVQLVANQSFPFSSVVFACFVAVMKNRKLATDRNRERRRVSSRIKKGGPAKLVQRREDRNARLVAFSSARRVCPSAAANVAHV